MLRLITVVVVMSFLLGVACGQSAENKAEPSPSVSPIADTSIASPPPPSGEDTQKPDSVTPSPRAGRVTEEAKLFNSIKDSVFKVVTDRGSGSAFLVSKEGLLLTNQHVVDETNFVSVEGAEKIRFRASVLEEDPESDVAVLLIHPDRIGDASALPLATGRASEAVVVGEKVIAIGSPLHQTGILTLGIVSQVDQDVIISDVAINHGNSGGPVINMDGAVIGIATFGDPDSTGPGVSGIVAIARARPVLERAKVKVPTSKPPSPSALPQIAGTPIPSQAIDDAMAKKLKPYDIGSPANLTCFIYTPFTVASVASANERKRLEVQNKRAKSRSDKGVKETHGLRPTRYWERYISDIDDMAPVVAIMAKPDLRETGASKRGGLVSAILVGGRLGKKHYSFRDDFYDMELYRGETLFEAIRPYRTSTKWLYEDYENKAIDQATGGFYLYDPRAFEPGEQVVLRIRKESDLTKWHEVKIDKKTQQKIWDEFASWRQAAGLP